MRLVELTNQAQGTTQSIMEVANKKNLAIQYKIIAAASDTVELQLWGTVYSEDDNNTDDDWIEVTEFLTEHKNHAFKVTNDTVHDISFLDSELTFAKIKLKYIVTSATPNNFIKTAGTQTYNGYTHYSK